MEVFFRDLVRSVDSSLLEEWERLRNPDFRALESAEPLPPGAEEAARAAASDITADEKSFTASVRARVFAFLSALGRQDFEGALEALAEGAPDPGPGRLSTWTPDALRERLRAYRESHGPFLLDPVGRSAERTWITKDASKGTTAEGAGETWSLRQILVDSEGQDDWAATFNVDLAASRAAGLPILGFEGLGETGM
jgi:hypothetical protein